MTALTPTDRLLQTIAARLDIRQAPDCPPITAQTVRRVLSEALAEQLGESGGSVWLTWEGGEMRVKVCSYEAK